MMTRQSRAPMRTVSPSLRRRIDSDQLAPGSERLGRLGADVDDSPAWAVRVLVGQRPQADVVELKRYGHAQPQHAGRDLAHLARSRRLATEILQRVGRGLLCILCRGGRNRPASNQPSLGFPLQSG